MPFRDFWMPLFKCWLKAWTQPVLILSVCDYLLLHKTLNGAVPSVGTSVAYSLIKLSSRPLRSSQQLLATLKFRLKTCYERAFAVAALKLYGTLLELRFSIDILKPFF